MLGPSDMNQRDWLMDYPPPRSLPLDQEALRIYERAYWAGTKTEKPQDPPVSFSTVLMALLFGEDETSRWFAQQAVKNGPELQAMLADKGSSEEAIRSLAVPAGQPSEVKLASDNQLLTGSARAVLTNAENWAHSVGASDIGVRHIVAAYVLNPLVYHNADLKRWKFQESKWDAIFYAWVPQHYTAEQWIDASQRAAPASSSPVFSTQAITGEDIDYPGDSTLLEVLRLAAAYHGSSKGSDPEQSLSLRTLFFALIDSAEIDTTVQAAIAPVWNAVLGVKAQYKTERAKYLPATVTNGVAFEEIAISPRVLNVLGTARDLAKVTDKDERDGLLVGVLHLAGALISRRVDGDEELAAIGLVPDQVRGELIQHVQAQHGAVDAWREVLGEEEIWQAGRPLELNSDEPEAVIRLDDKWKYDPLAIRPDVESFAALLATRSLEPPLSIGLFGPWGSGKTTFLKRLRRAVERLTTGARDAQTAGRPTDYVGNVVHVEFNAWHFAESALTSSLIDTILRALNDYIKDETPVGGKEWREQKRLALVSAKRKVEAAQAVEAAARASVADAENRATNAQAKAREKTTALQSAVTVAWSAARVELANNKAVKDSGVLDAVGDTIKSSEELQARLEALRKRPTPIVHDLGWGFTLLFAALVITVPLLASWAAERILGSSQGSEFVASMAAMLGVIGVWARKATDAVAKVDQAIAKVDEEYDRLVAAEPEVKAAQADLAAAQASAAAAAASLQAAQQELIRAQTEAANATVPAQMLQLVSTRLEDHSYNKELTTVSLARADLEALSLLLRRDQQDAAQPAGGATHGLRVVDRVILYIDDLDRCKPRDVVRVLQLVHMLLAFELFVVVVAVDARWVAESVPRQLSLAGRWRHRCTGQNRRGSGPRARQHGAASRRKIISKRSSKFRSGSSR